MRGKNSSAPLRTNHFLIFNLAVADLLMGIYLIMLGIAGGVYSGRFCAYDISWRSGVTCKIMGVLVVLSSETSVMTMLLLASFRLFAVLKVKKKLIFSLALLVTFRKFVLLKIRNCQNLNFHLQLSLWYLFLELRKQSNL